MKKLTMKETEDLFLDLFYELIPEAYNALWYEGIAGAELISNCALVYPKLYRKLLDMLEEECAKKGYILP